MITPEMRARIAAEVATWRPLDSAERDLVRRALAPAPHAGAPIAPELTHTTMQDEAEGTQP